MSAGKYIRNRAFCCESESSGKNAALKVANKGSKIHSLQIQMGKLLQRALDLFGGERAREN
jgi:hypothetical protein